MDAPINEIIKNIIHIDKSAVQLREKLSKEIGERKNATNNEIEKLRESILDSEMKRIDKREREEISKAEAEAEGIRNRALKKSSEMHKSFLSSKNDLIKEMFRNIVSE